MTSSNAIRSLRDRYEQPYWDRQANPYSGRAQLATGPLLVYAFYCRNWKLLGATLVFALASPAVFPEREVDSDSWFTRASRASESSLAAGTPVFGREWPGVLNVATALTFLYTLAAARRQRPVGTAVGTALFMGLKLWYLDELVREYDRREEE